jgi:Holliday junction resolvase RusA-like endonuclease
MIIKIPLKALSINAAFQGRRFKTKEHNRYCRDVALFLPKNQKICGWVVVRYRFYLKNWKITDGGNLEKCLSDCIVKANIIDDDRFIMRYIIEKYPAKEDRIEVEITEYEREAK